MQTETIYSPVAGAPAGTRRRIAAAAVVTALVAVGTVTGSAAPAGAETSGNSDALQARVRAELAVFTDWLRTYGVAGYVGEVGWPGDADAAKWNALAQKWYADAAAAGVWTTAWATGEWWGCAYKLAAYTWSTCSTMDGALSVARSQASVIEAQAGGYNRGVNVAGGEFGTPGPLEATSSFSNANPGAYDSAYHFDVQQSFDYLASRGLTLVRLPVRWERVQRTLGGPLDPAEVQRIADAVGRARAAGLQVILDVHNYGAYWLFDGTRGVRRPIGSAQVGLNHFADLWGRLSNQFKADPGVLGYGLMNEPVGMAGPTVWEQASQVALDAIRRNGDTKVVLVPGYNWSGAQQWTSQHPRPWVTDPAGNVRYEAHHYWDRDNSSHYAASYDSEVADAQARGYSASPATTTTTTKPPVTTTTTTTTPATTTTTKPPVTTTTTTPPVTTTTTTTTAPAAASDTVAPTTPGSFTATGGKSRATLAWQASVDSGGSGIAGYEIYRAPSYSGPYTKIATVTSPGYVDYSVVRRASYAFYAVAVDKAGNRSAGSTISVVYVT